MKKTLSIALCALLALGTFAGCGEKAPKEFDYQSDFTVVSREEGSGTRGAFVELFGIEKKGDDGKKVDHTTIDAVNTNSTSVMLSTVAGNDYAIGYVSLGSLNDSVKAVKIDGAEASVANIKSGTYKIARPFNVATKGELSDVAKDFMDFILSKDGQAVVEQNGYIANDNAKSFTSAKPTGKIVVAGSSSVTPVMEKLKEAYLKINSGAQIDVQQSDSTTGVTSAIDGICDIGMASRQLKDTELAKGVTSTTIATDGIAVVINKNSPVADLTSAQVEQIFTGNMSTWAGLQ